MLVQFFSRKRLMLTRLVHIFFTYEMLPYIQKNAAGRAVALILQYITKGGET